jgi:hypothetical protein
MSASESAGAGVLGAVTARGWRATISEREMTSALKPLAKIPGVGMKGIRSKKVLVE